MNTKIVSFAGNVGKALLNAIVVFLGLYGSALVAGIPAHISTMTVGGIVSLVISLITHSVSTPAGATVTKPV